MAEDMDGIDDLSGFLKSAVPIVETRTFGAGETAFEVQLRRLDKRDLERLLKAGRKRSFDKRAREWREEVDAEAMRYELAEKGLAGWSGLTLHKVLLLTNHDPAAANGNGQRAVNFSIENAVELMRMARGVVDGVPTAFEEWVLDGVTDVADRGAHEESAGLKG